jgi:hypothetical protein
MGGIYEVCSLDGVRRHDIQYIPNLIKISSGIRNLVGGIYRHTDSKVTS